MFLYYLLRKERFYPAPQNTSSLMLRMKSSIIFLKENLVLQDEELDLSTSFN